ncbi:MAG: GFA family protein, partial [Mesorhizobium sp.]
SSAAWRGFCAECGTPLTFEAPDGVALAIAAFDDPAGIAPTIQWGVEAKLPYVDGVSKLPSEETMGDISSAPYLAELVSYQHPDHDTDQWPPEEKP